MFFGGGEEKEPRDPGVFLCFFCVFLVLIRDFPGN